MRVIAVPRPGKNFEQEVGLSSKLMTDAGLLEGDPVSVWNGRQNYLLYVRSADTPHDKVAFVPKSLLADATDVRIEPTLPNEITIGCDPEFILIDKKNQVRDASRIFRKEARLGSDAILGELRPPPSRYVPDTVEMLRGLINRIPTVTKYAPIAMSWYKRFLCGFHVHIGLPPEIVLFAFDGAADFVKNFIRLFDYYVGIPALLRDNSDKRRLCRDAYGRPGDYRMSRHTVEYRTPGGFHLRSPELAEGLLTASYVLAEDVLGRAALETRLWTKPTRFCSYEHFADSYSLPAKPSLVESTMLAENRAPASRELERIRVLYEKLYSYNRSKEVLASFLSGEKSSDNPYMQQNWSTTRVENT